MKDGDPIPRKPPTLRRSLSSEERLAEAKRLCFIACAKSCVEEKRASHHLKLLKSRPHWSDLKREEQYKIIDRGESEPFDIAIPLPAKDRRDPEGTSWGVDLFWERFRCRECGRCCYTPGAGLYLKKVDMERICQHLGWSRKRLKSLCRYDKDLKVWALKQPCPFYDPDKGCTIYPARPLTCTRYPLHPPLKEMPSHLAVDAFCPAAREFVKETLGWWIVCEANWARILKDMEG
ncbi:YkgJ family cysteine cluster protein [Methanocrinis sp.]|uniref:YkgJ family cysteine cluster protein n=1 Tax=Methanocrinis sp. TaxID=3101522 RepID=UPI003D0A368D